MSRGARAIARRFQARVTVHTSAADLAATDRTVGRDGDRRRRRRHASSTRAPTASRAWPSTWACSASTSRVDGPPELVAAIQALAGRYARATVGARPD